MNEPKDTEIIRAMRTYGGSFLQALGSASQLADTDNLSRIKAAWPEYWASYKEFVPHMRKNDQQEESQDA